MELQAIREKLLQLQAEPAATDVLSAPWSSPQPSPQSITEAAYRQQLANKAHPAANSAAQTPQAAVLKTLQERSGSTGAARPTAASEQANSLVAHEIDRLQVLASNINERSHQQAAEILAIKRSAQQAAVALRRQGIHHHPDLQIIEQFLAAYPSASVPVLERDSRGQFCLNHSVIELNRAEQDASNIAQVLRQRRQSGAPLSEKLSETVSSTYSGSSVLFSEPIEHDIHHPSDVEMSKAFSDRRGVSTKRRKGGVKNLLSPLKKLLRFTRKRDDRLDTFASASREEVTGSSFNSSFSWTDAAIWFSGAAIARIVLEAVVVSMPLLRMPILLLLFSAISFSIYRVVVAKSTNMPSVYRLAITLIGLIVGGSL